MSVSQALKLIVLGKQCLDEKTFLLDTKIFSLRFLAWWKNNQPKKHSGATKVSCPLTWNFTFRIERAKGVFHKHPISCGLILPQFVLHDQSVQTIVHVGGLVEGETTVLHWSVSWVRNEVGVHETGIDYFFVVVEPGECWLRIPIHSEGKTPVVVLHSVLQEEDFDRNWWEMADLEI